MTTYHDGDLLAKYVQENSEEAFRTLMFRYANLVYGVCKRTLGNAELAEDATQTVFLLLARNAKKLSGRATVAGWLHTCSLNVSRTLARKEGTRKTYETMATPIAPAKDPFEESLKQVVDGALDKLKEEEREAILLRYFQDASYPELGQLLNIGEDAARMRFNRALESLRQKIGKAGLALSPAELTSLLPKTAETAPSTLLQKLGALPTLGSAPTPTLTKGISRTIMISSPIIVSLVIVGAFSVSGTRAPKIAVRSLPAVLTTRQPKAPSSFKLSFSDQERKVDAKEGLNALIAEFQGIFTWKSFAVVDGKPQDQPKDAATVAYDSSKHSFKIEGQNGFTNWTADPSAGTFEEGGVVNHFVSGSEKKGTYTLIFSGQSSIAKYRLTITFDQNKFEFVTKTTAVMGSPKVEATFTFERRGVGG